jgi:signal peptidase II
VHQVQGSRRVPLDLAHPGRVFIGVSASILLVDQITKAIVRAYMQVDQTVGLIPHVIRLTLVRNTGAAFGIFPGRQPVFVITSLLVLFAIAAYWRRARPTQWLVVVALAMIAGGALGNLIDRALIGRVTDFFEFAFIDFPVFNVADMGIVGGVGALMVWVLFGPEPPGSTVADADDSEPSASTSAESLGP